MGFMNILELVVMQTGGVGDTSFMSLVKLFEHPGHHLHLGLGISAPTGDVDLQFRRIAREGRWDSAFYDAIRQWHLGFFYLV